MFIGMVERWPGFIVCRLTIFAFSHLKRRNNKIFKNIAKSPSKVNTEGALMQEKEIIMQGLKLRKKWRLEKL
jgi:hypothetical protein